MREATEERDREYPNGGPVLNHRPTDEELMKTILMHALDKCTVPSIHQYYNTLLETKNKNVSFEEIFEEIHHLALTANRATGAKRKFESQRTGRRAAPRDTARTPHPKSKRSYRTWTDRRRASRNAKTAAVIST